MFMSKIIREVDFFKDSKDLNGLKNLEKNLKDVLEIDPYDDLNMENFNEYLNEVYGSFKFGNIEFPASKILCDLDNILYNEELANYTLSSPIEDSSEYEFLSGLIEETIKGVI